MLQLQDVTITYQRIVPAVHGVLLEVPDQQIVALIQDGQRTGRFMSDLPDTWW
ncbi:MAG TPA: hypothetical protein VF510_04670 [Ktedonobacterales bacterium]